MIPRKSNHIAESTPSFPFDSISPAEMLLCPGHVLLSSQLGLPNFRIIDEGEAAEGDIIATNPNSLNNYRVTNSDVTSVVTIGSVGRLENIYDQTGNGHNSASSFAQLSNPIFRSGSLITTNADKVAFEQTEHSASYENIVSGLPIPNEFAFYYVGRFNGDMGGTGPIIYQTDAFEMGCQYLGSNLFAVVPSGINADFGSNPNNQLFLIEHIEAEGETRFRFNNGSVISDFSSWAAGSFNLMTSNGATATSPSLKTNFVGLWSGAGDAARSLAIRTALNNLFGIW